MLLRATNIRKNRFDKDKSHKVELGIRLSVFTKVKREYLNRKLDVVIQISVWKHQRELKLNWKKFQYSLKGKLNKTLLNITLFEK